MKHNKPTNILTNKEQTQQEQKRMRDVLSYIRHLSEIFSMVKQLNGYENL